MPGGERLELYRITLMITEICLPKIKKSMTRASIGRWFKRVGDPVSVDEPLVEIETDNRRSRWQRQPPACCPRFL